MAESHLTCDKNEIILITKINGENKQLTFSHDQIVRIQFDKIMERKLFRQVPSEKIEIQIKNRSNPFTFTKLKEKGYFDEYKNELIKFTKDKKVALIDNTVK